jgi:photosystem I P700 chlorophyll a apoprotein A1
MDLNLHADAHDFDMQTKSLEDISRKISVPTLDNLQSFSFGLVECTSMVLISNYTAWLMNPLQIKPSAQSVWPVVGQEILNADVGGNFQGIQITSGSSKFGVPV